MTKRYTTASKELQPCQQWQHETTKETVQILGTTSVKCSRLSDFTVTFLEISSGIRATLTGDEFLWHYDYIPPMKGAYR